MESGTHACPKKWSNAFPIGWICSPRSRDLGPAGLIEGRAAASSPGSFLSILEEYVESEPDLNRLRHPKVHPLVREIVRLFQSDITHLWTLPELAETVLCDRAYLSRLCRKHAGLPPMALLSRMRADRAGYLLATTSLPVGNIGTAVGWPNPDHFAKRFRDHFGQSASAYREKTRRVGKA